MKKVLFTVIFIMLTLISSVFAQTEVSMYDSENAVIEIKGTALPDEDIKILILNPEKTIEEAQTDSGARQYNDTVYADGSGEYVHRIKLYKPSAGYYKVYIKEGSGDVTEYEIYYATLDEKVSAAKEVISAPTLLSDKNKREVLGVEDALINAINTEELFDFMNEDLKNNPISFSDNDSNEEKSAKLLDLQSRIKKYTILSAYNQSKAQYLYSNDGSFRYDDILGFSEIDKNNQTTINELYNKQIKDTSYVRNAILGKNVKSIDELKRLFADNVVYYAIVNNKNTGYGHIESCITMKNILYIKNVNESDNPLKAYFSLGTEDRKKADFNIMQNAEKLTVDNYFDIIKECSEKAKSNNEKGGGGGNVSSRGNGTFVPGGTVSQNDSKSDNSGNGFSDVPNGNWAKDFVEYVTECGIIDGIGNNKFGPDLYLTREQAAKVICLTFKLSPDNTAEKVFSDTDVKQWYCPYVNTAYKNKIINGKDKENFGIGENITRQDFAVMIYRAAETGEKTVSECDILDYNSISDYAKEAVGYLKDSGIISGYEDGSFMPMKNITRAEMAKIIYNVIQKYKYVYK